MVGASHIFEHYSATPLYNTKSVVSKTGVPADTFRAWERRHGVPQPHRGKGGQRLYSERDVAVIRWLRDRTDEGLTISQAVVLLQADEADKADLRDITQPRSFEALRSDLLHALLQFDAPKADNALSEAFALYSLDTVCTNIIQPVMIEVGELWHSGKATVAQEHFGTQFLRRKLLALLNIYDVAEGRATVLTACAAGEQHDLGLLLLSLLLVRRNYRIVFLGTDVPHAALLQAVAHVRPNIVCISATTPATSEQALVSARAVHAHHPDTLVIIGGQGIVDQLETGDGIYHLASHGVAAVEQIGALLAAKRTHT